MAKFKRHLKYLTRCQSGRTKSWIGNQQMRLKDQKSNQWLSWKRRLEERDSTKTPKFSASVHRATPDTDHINAKIELRVIPLASKISTLRLTIRSQTCQFNLWLRLFQVFNAIPRWQASLTSFIISEARHLTYARHFHLNLEIVPASRLHSWCRYYQTG